jgi:hypothetical protein
MKFMPNVMKDRSILLSLIAVGVSGSAVRDANATSEFELSPVWGRGNAPMLSKCHKEGTDG